MGETGCNVDDLHRPIFENPSDLPYRLRHPLPRPFHNLGFHVQHSHEDLLHPFKHLYRISHRRKVPVRELQPGLSELIFDLCIRRPMDDEESTDTFSVQYIFIPCAILSLICNYRFTVPEVLWSFSIFLEALAILPQLHMLRITGQAEALTRYYIITLGLYRALYLPNWIWRCVLVPHQSLCQS
jgi:hypothetical protein